MRATIETKGPEKVNAKTHRPYEMDMARERGRDLKTGISYKCQQGHHKDCTAARCECHCLHGQIPGLLEAVTRCAAQACSRNEGHKGYHLCSVCHVTLPNVEYDEHECYPPSSEIHLELPSGAVARVVPTVEPETLVALDEMMKAVVRDTERKAFASCGIELERKQPSDEITFAGLTAGLGRRGVPPPKNPERG